MTIDRDQQIAEAIAREWPYYSCYCSEGHEPLCEDCQPQADRIADALRRARAEQGWQLIETAPKDRGFLLAFNDRRKVYGLVCWWPGGGFNGEGCWAWTDENIAWSRERGNQPTHWMPLPSPPGATSPPREEER
jgi:hypothetical protein